MGLVRFMEEELIYYSDSSLIKRENGKNLSLLYSKLNNYYVILNSNVAYRMDVIMFRMTDKHLIMLFIIK